MSRDVGLNDETAGDQGHGAERKGGQDKRVSGASSRAAFTDLRLDHAGCAPLPET